MKKTILFAIAVVALTVAPAAFAQWTTANGVTYEQTNKISIGNSTIPSGAGFQVYSTADPVMFVTTQNSGGTLGYGVRVRDPLAANEGFTNGVLLDLGGNSIMRVAGLRIGYLGNPSIDSSTSLYLNAYQGGDVVVGSASLNNGLRVLGTGISTVMGKLGIGTSTPAVPLHVNGNAFVNGQLGIGTSTPAYPLQVVGVGSFSAGVSVDTTGTSKGRMTSNLPNWFGMTSNASYAAGSGWNLDDTTLPGWFAKVDSRSSGDSFGVFRIPAGANPHTNEVGLFVVSGTALSGAGGVGIKTQTPREALDVNGNIIATNITATGTLTMSSSSSGFTVSTSGVGKGRVMNAGTTGTTNQSAIGLLSNASFTASNANWTLDDTSAPGWALIENSTTDQFTLSRITAGANPRTAANQTTMLTVTSAGRVGITTTTPREALDVTGNIVASGNISADGVINAKYQDVAEWVPATTKMDAGTVVVLNRDRENEVTRSAHAYDTAVAGVVSAQPGVVLGVPSESKAQVATTGRVKVHVDATRGAVAIGDLLVTSDRPGFAMKSDPVEVAGVRIHRPGTVIGKALQALPNGEGDILVLLSLQ